MKQKSKRLIDYKNKLGLRLGPIINHQIQFLILFFYKDF